MLTVEKQWINVQQKTFTKWYVDPGDWSWGEGAVMLIQLIQ